MDGLEKMQPFIVAVAARAREAALEETISALLNLIEDTSNLILTYVSDNVAGTWGELVPVRGLIQFGAHSTNISWRRRWGGVRTSQRTAPKVQGPQREFRPRCWDTDDESSLHQR